MMRTSNFSHLGFDLVTASTDLETGFPWSQFCMISFARELASPCMSYVQYKDRLCSTSGDTTVVPEEGVQYQEGCLPGEAYLQYEERVCSVSREAWGAVLVEGV